MADEYVELRDGGYWLKGSRVSLDSIVYAYLSGEVPECIARSFPTTSLYQIYGAIGFYLNHRPQIDAYLEEAKANYEAERLASRALDPAFYQKLADARRS